MKNKDLPDNLDPEYFLRFKSITRYLVGKNYDIKVAFKTWKAWVEWYITKKPYKYTDADWKKVRNIELFFMAGIDNLNHPICYMRSKHSHPK